MITHILLIEDNPDDVELFVRTINDGASVQHEISHYDSIETFMQQPVDQTYDLVMLDMGLPGISGFEAVEAMQQYDGSLPIIILTGLEDEQMSMEAARRGVQDYLIKGESSGELIRRSIRYAIERKRHQDKILYLQQCDHLTGLFSREVFHALLSQAVSQSEQNKSSLAVYYIDIDNFKQINDFYGQDVGNILLTEVAARLCAFLIGSRLAARLGADRFLMALEGTGEMDCYTMMAEKILSSLREPFIIANQEITITATIGMAYCKAGKYDANSLLKRGERALSGAKESGRNCYRFFTDALDAATEERIFISRALPAALKQNEFHLCYHPKIDFGTGKITGVEALLRWVHPEKGFIPPDVFIPIAEQNGLIHDITVWVLNEIEENFELFSQHKLDVAVNLSAIELGEEGIVSWLQNVANTFDSVGCQLVLELTETAVMDDVEHSLSVMRAIKDMKIKLHLDDFGTGYSSLSYLRALPVDALKIDRSFVRDMVEDTGDKHIVELVISLAHVLGMEVIAEGVEDANIEGQLRDMGCDLAQGFHYTKPIPANELKLWLNDRQLTQ